jgi:hypothetical protein
MTLFVHRPAESHNTLSLVDNTPSSHDLSPFSIIFSLISQPSIKTIIIANKHALHAFSSTAGGTDKY